MSYSATPCADVVLLVSDHLVNQISNVILDHSSPLDIGLSAACQPCATGEANLG